MKKQLVIIERGTDGQYSAYAPDLQNAPIGTGANIEEARKDFLNTVSEMRDVYNKDGKPVPEELNAEFEFQIRSTAKKDDLMKEARSKAIIDEYESYKSRLKDYVKTLFKDTGLLQLELTVSYFEQRLPFPPSLNVWIVREMLYIMPGVTRSSDSHRVHFPRYITHKDRALGAKEEVGTLYWTKYGKKCRPFVFDAKYFLSPDEYIEFKARNLAGFSAKGITYNDVRNCLRLLQEEIPATDEICAEYTFNVAPATEAQNGREATPDFFVMNVKVKKMSINLRVEGFALVSDKEV